MREISKQAEKKLKEIISECSYFSIALDESTDVSDTSQMLIFIGCVNDKFQIHEELLDLASLHSTAKGVDVFNEVSKSIHEFCNGFEKLYSVATDRAPAMVGKKEGFVGQLIQRNIDAIPIHCIIHQQALCGKALKMDSTMKTVSKIINSIRGGHNSLTHRKFKKFLEEVDAEYGDLIMYTEVRWLSRGKSLIVFSSRGSAYISY